MSDRLWQLSVAVALLVLALTSSYARPKNTAPKLAVVTLPAGPLVSANGGSAR